MLEAAHEKNRKGSIIPLRPDLAAELKTHLDAQAVPPKPSSRLLAVPLHLVRHLTADLEAAGIPKVDKRGFILDVHALRHTFGTNLAKGGVHPRVAQELMRHADSRLTANIYTHVVLGDATDALNALPKLATSPLVPASAVAPPIASTSVETSQNESLPVNI